MKPIDHHAIETGAESIDRPLIVHVVRQFLPNRGGLEDVVHSLCMFGLHQGYRIRVVTLDSLFSNPELTLPSREIIHGIEVVRIPWRGGSRYPLAPSVLSHIEDADLIHVHAIDFFFDFLAITQLMHRKPMIATTHGGFFHTKKFATIKKIWFSTLTRFSASRYAAVVGCSISDFETFRPIAGDRTQLIENGADVLKFSNASSLRASKHMVTLGRFSVNKRLDRLIATMEVLVKRDPTWHLDILGVPSDLSVADLERQIADRGLTANVSVRAGLSNEDIRSLLSQASFFVSASEYEGFGLVAIEAMSAGLLPVLSPNTAYQNLAVRHKDIPLCDFADVEAAANAIEQAYLQLGSDSALRGRLMDQGRSYSWDNAGAAYGKLYERALEGAAR